MVSVVVPQLSLPRRVIVVVQFVAGQMVAFFCPQGGAGSSGYLGAGGANPMMLDGFPGGPWSGCADRPPAGRAARPIGAAVRWPGPTSERPVMASRSGQARGSRAGPGFLALQGTTGIALHGLEDLRSRMAIRRDPMPAVPL